MLDPGRRIVRGTGRAPQGAHLADLLHRPAQRGARTGVGVCPARRSPERRSDSWCHGTDAHGPPVVRARGRADVYTGVGTWPAVSSRTGTTSDRCSATASLALDRAIVKSTYLMYDRWDRAPAAVQGAAPARARPQPGAGP